jgi:hypothetical protein
MSIGNIKDFGLYIRHAAAGGLAATKWSLAYSLGVLGRHFHSYERWFAAAAVPVGETHVADRIGPLAVTPFQPDAGDSDWGPWLQVLGSTDLPVMPDRVYFDPHRIDIIDTERLNEIHFLQIAFGETGAAALAAGTYTEHVFKSAGGAPNETPPVVIQTRRQPVDTKVWVRVMVPGQNTGWVKFFYGIHEYEG